LSILSNLFGGNQKRDTSYQGPKPYGSLLEAEGGKPYYDTIMSRLKGQGVGYGEGYADRNASPIVANMRNQFTSYQLPELKSELSATGRRRGSAGFDQMRRAYQEQGLNEGDVFARLQQQNDVQSRNEINDALEKLGAFNKGDYDARNIASNFYKGLNDDQVRDAANQRAEGNAAFQRLIGVGTSLLPTSMPSFGGIRGGQSMLSQQYATQQYPQVSQGYYPGVSSISKKFGQQGAVSPYSTRLKY